ncbi:MAG: asparaginase [Candidatus Kerfeldbacteria bacterium]|nr:asparaginase [Candidatus Kerfeldbacteria bacterium]
MKRICLLHTGGTITMFKNAAGVLQPPTSGEYLLEYVPNITKIADIDNVFLFQLDSSDINPRHWKVIAEAIAERYDRYDGFVITHGTDTMAYTATALSFMLGNLSKPVIVTGSQLPISEIASDGVTNLINAVRMACEPISEVAIMFGHHLIRGNRSKKVSHFNLDAFISPNCLPLSELGAELRLADHCMVRRSKQVQLQTDLVTDVAFIKIFPGITNAFILGMVPPRTRGVIFEAYGTGNFPLGDEGIQEAMENIISQGIPTVISTQCIYGGVEYERYQGGWFAKSRGAITAQDMTSEAALIKLMWCLGQSSDDKEIKRLYQTNVVGELTERETRP